jgi:hypothetical protein
MENKQILMDQIRLLEFDLKELNAGKHIGALSRRRLIALVKDKLQSSKEKLAADDVDNPPQCTKNPNTCRVAFCDFSKCL